jgi:peptidoglycan/xylan/chitin deacetylase (PgdA/CDA1 family)
MSHAIRRLKNAYFSRHGSYQFDPNWNFAWYMSTLEANDSKGAFYFIPTSGRTQFDCRYSLAERRMQALLKSISDRGHQIGMHGSYTTYRNSPLVERERLSLMTACRSAGAADAVSGNRQHYLRWDAGQTADHLDHAGFTYDSSGGYADNPGFRYGTARSFPMWSWIKHAPLKLRQHPLVLMESSVISYLNLGYTAEAFDLMRRLKKAALKYGDFTMLWHNSSFSTPDDVKLFTEILAA